MAGYKDPPKETQFKKGDPRINRNGRPKSFDKLRQLAKQIANEDAYTKEGKLLVINEHKVTQIEALLRDLMRKNPKLFLEYAYGAPPKQIEVSGPEGKPIEFKEAIVELPKDDGA